MPAPTPGSHHSIDSARSASDANAAKRNPGKDEIHARAEPGHAVKAEEISDVMELAEAWMALHHPAKVLEILEPFSKAEQPQSPLPWLCLLDVHRVLGDRKKYEAILERIKRIFNVKLTPWAAQSGMEPPKALADFPHIRDRILELWEGNQALPYLESLLLDNRDGSREGFDLPVYRDILRLIALARDPDRLKRRAQMMHEKAYAILFAPPEQKPAITPEQPHDEIRPAPLAARPRERADTGHCATTGEAAQNKEPSFAATRTDVADVQAAPAPASSDTQDSPFSQEDMSPMAIKLHLAVAYQDIGDKEGACLLLEEVIHGGTAEQSEQARSMLAKLA